MTNKIAIAVIAAILTTVIVASTAYADSDSIYYTLCEEIEHDEMTNLWDTICGVDLPDMRSDINILNEDVTQIQILNDHLNLLIDTVFNHYNEVKRDGIRLETNLNQTNINLSDTILDVEDLEQRVSKIENPPVEFTAKIDYKRNMYRNGDLMFVSGTADYSTTKVLKLHVQQAIRVPSAPILFDATIRVQSDNTYEISVEVDNIIKQGNFILYVTDGNKQRTDVFNARVYR